MKYAMLQVDLGNRSCEAQEIPEGVIRKYVGGRGLGSYLLYNLVPGQIDPLGAENHVIFTAGPASDTDLFFSSKVCLNTKSPLTGIYLYSISSGILARQMRKAGFWALDIKGVSDSPIYLVIHNLEVQFKDASFLWGMEPAEAQRMMLEGRDPKKAATVGIGPAGEQLVTSAAVFSEGSLYRCFGRGGGGAVMGSKKLKGLVVAGDGETRVGGQNKLSALNKEMAGRLRTDLKVWADRWRAYETAADLVTMNDLGYLPTRNWQAGQFEEWRGIDKSTTPMGWPKTGIRPCGPYCPASGCRDVKVKKGPYKGAHSDLEWETVYAFGTTCGVNKMEPIIAASQLCDEFGIDSMTAGVTIGFAMECFERGLIDKKDTEGIDLRFGNDEAMIAMLKKMVGQEGFGRELLKGTRRLSQEIKGSEAFAMHAKGMEFGGYECRGSNGQALQFAIDNRGGCHHGYGLPARIEATDGTRLNVEGKGEYVKKAAISRIIRDCLVVCTFPPLFESVKVMGHATGGSTIKNFVVEVLSSLFGETWSEDDIREVGVRVMCQERLFNMREGITEKDDTLPARLLTEPKPDGPTKGAVVPLRELKEDYYKAMGYDLASGNPPDSLLAKLGIDK